MGDICPPWPALLSDKSFSYSKYDRYALEEARKAHWHEQIHRDILKPKEALRECLHPVHSALGEQPLVFLGKGMAQVRQGKACAAFPAAPVDLTSGTNQG